MCAGLLVLSLSGSVLLKRESVVRWSAIEFVWFGFIEKGIWEIVPVLYCVREVGISLTIFFFTLLDISKGQYA